MIGLHNLRMQRTTRADARHGRFGEGVALVAADPPIRYAD